MQIKKNAQCHSHQKHHESLSLKEKAQGKWTEDKHNAFMMGFEQYGNNWNEVATLVSTQTPVQIKKHAECHFKQNLKTNAATVQQHQESLSPNTKTQILANDAAAHQKH